MIYVMSGDSEDSNLKDAYAIILVEYPAGSTCTCTNGAKTFKAGNTYGAWAFGVTGGGTWTITATDGVKSNSKSVEITTEWQIENITVNYDIFLYNNGVFDAKVPHSLSANKGTLSEETNYIRYDTVGGSVNTAIICFGPLDLTDYNSIQTSGRSPSSSDTNLRHDIYITDTLNGTPFSGTIAILTNFRTSSSGGTYDINMELDVSEIVGEHYVCYSMNTNNASWTNRRTDSQLYSVHIE